MAVAKSNQEMKREKRREKKAALERLTNWYMINLSWGIVGIVALRFVENGFSSADTILIMPTVMKVIAAIFAIVAVALFVCGKTKVLKNTSRCFNYGIFTAVIALVSLEIGFYNKVLIVLRNMNIAPADSRWLVSWGFIAAIVAYLVLALIWTGVRIAMVEKGKKA